MEAVTCHSGFTYAERPIALTWEEQRLVIQEILASWRVLEGRIFQVRTEDGRRFMLTYSEREDRWSIQPI